jgi:hypothetical protein
MKDLPKLFIVDAKNEAFYDSSSPSGDQPLEFTLPSLKTGLSNYKSSSLIPKSTRGIIGSIYLKTKRFLAGVNLLTAIISLVFLLIIWRCIQRRRNLFRGLITYDPVVNVLENTKQK